jgi:hypothetical protein
MLFKILQHIQRKMVLTTYLHLQHFVGGGGIGEILMGRETVGYRNYKI